MVAVMPGFFAVFTFVQRLSVIDTLCLNLLLIALSLLSKCTWTTWALGVVFVSQSYVVTVCILSTPTCSHIGIQLRTTNALHTLAYQVFPIPAPVLPPPDYRVSRQDLLIQDILFDRSGLPDYHVPGTDKDAVLGVPPPYPRCIGFIDDHAVPALVVAPPTPPPSLPNGRPNQPYGLRRDPNPHRLGPHNLDALL
jgi:hypothetical protein